MKPWLLARVHELGLRWVSLKCLAPLGLKYILVEALIEIPFLLLELSLWVGPLFGFSVGLSLWQRIMLTIGLYALVEGVRWAVARARRRPYRLFQAERELLKLLADRLRRRAPELA